MPKYLHLPSGNSIAIGDNEDPRQAWLRAQQDYPDEFRIGPKAEPKKEDYGFGSALKSSGTRMLGEAALTAGKAGIMGLPEAEAIHQRMSQRADELHKPTQDSWFESPWQKLKEAAGSSAAYMAAPAAAGLAALAAPAVAPGLAAAVGTGALGAGLAGLASLGQYTGSNLAAQMEEGNKGLADTSGLAAVSAAVPQAALDVLSFKMIPGITTVFKSLGKEVTEAQAKAMAAQTLKQKVADYALKTGQTMGIEGVTEVAQDVLEKLQAGASITDPKARADYLENFLGGAALAGVLGPFGRAYERGSIYAKGKELEGKRQAAEKKAADEAAAQARSALAPEGAPLMLGYSQMPLEQRQALEAQRQKDEDARREEMFKRAAEARAASAQQGIAALQRSAQQPAGIAALLPFNGQMSEKPQGLPATPAMRGYAGAHEQGRLFDEPSARPAAPPAEALESAAQNPTSTLPGLEGPAKPPQAGTTAFERVHTPGRPMSTTEIAQTAARLAERDDLTDDERALLERVQDLSTVPADTALPPAKPTDLAKLGKRQQRLQRQITEALKTDLPTREERDVIDEMPFDQRLGWLRRKAPDSPLLRQYETVDRALAGAANPLAAQLEQIKGTMAALQQRATQGPPNLRNALSEIEARIGTLQGQETAANYRAQQFKEKLAALEAQYAAQPADALALQISDAKTQAAAAESDALQAKKQRQQALQARDGLFSARSRAQGLSETDRRRMARLEQQAQAIEARIQNAEKAQPMLDKLISPVDQERASYAGQNATEEPALTPERPYDTATLQALKERLPDNPHLNAELERRAAYGQIAAGRAPKSNATVKQRIAEWLQDRAQGRDTTNSRRALDEALAALNSAKEDKSQQGELFSGPEEPGSKGTLTESASAFRKLLASEPLQKLRAKLGLTKPTVEAIKAQIEKLKQEAASIKQKVEALRALEKQAGADIEQRVQAARLELAKVTRDFTATLTRYHKAYAKAQIAYEDAKATYDGLNDFFQTAARTFEEAVQEAGKYEAKDAANAARTQKQADNVKAELAAAHKAYEEARAALGSPDEEATGDIRGEMLRASRRWQAAIRNERQFMAEREQAIPAHLRISEQEILDALEQDMENAEMLRAQRTVLHAREAAVQQAADALELAKMAQAATPKWRGVLDAAQKGLATALTPTSNAEVVATGQRPLQEKLNEVTRRLAALNDDADATAAQRTMLSNEAADLRKELSKLTTVPKALMTALNQLNSTINSLQQEVKSRTGATKSREPARVPERINAKPTEAQMAAAEKFKAAQKRLEDEQKARTRVTFERFSVEDRAGREALEKEIAELKAKRDADAQVLRDKTKGIKLTPEVKAQIAEGKTTREEAVKAEANRRADKLIAKRNKEISKKESELAALQPIIRHVSTASRRAEQEAAMQRTRETIADVGPPELNEDAAHIAATQKRERTSQTVRSTSGAPNALRSGPFSRDENGNLIDRDEKEAADSKGYTNRAAKDAAVPPKTQQRYGVRSMTGDEMAGANADAARMKVEKAKETHADARKLAKRLFKDRKFETTKQYYNALLAYAKQRLETDFKNVYTIDEVAELEQAIADITAGDENAVSADGKPLRRAPKAKEQKALAKAVAEGVEADSAGEAEVEEAAEAATKGGKKQDAKPAAKPEETKPEEPATVSYKDIQAALQKLAATVGQFSKQYVDALFGVFAAPERLDETARALLVQGKTREFLQHLSKNAAKPDIRQGASTLLRKMAEKGDPDSPLYRVINHEYSDRENTALDGQTEKAVRSGDLKGALERLAEHGSTPFVRQVAKRLAGMVEDTKLKVTALDGVGGEFDPATNTVTLNADALTEEDLIHEPVHAATIGVIDAPAESLTPEQRTARDKLQALYAKMQGRAEFKGEYGATDFKEFVSELLSNKAVRDKIDATAGLLRRWYEGFLRMLGFNPATLSDKAAEQAMAMFSPAAKGAGRDERLASIMRGTFPGTGRQFSDTVPDAVAALANRTVARTATLGDKIVANASGLRVRTALFDSWAPVEQLLKQGVARGAVQAAKALQTRVYMRLFSNTQEYTNSALLNGIPTLKQDASGLYTIEGGNAKVNAQTIAKALRGANALGNEQAVEGLFTTWLAIKRAEKTGVGLDKLNFSKPPTAAEIAALDKMLNDHPEAKKAFEEARELYRQYNHALLDLQVKTGVMTQATANELGSGDYVGFYRVDGNGVVEAVIGGSKPVRIGNIIDQPYLKQLVGGDEHILPFFSGMVQNTSLLMSMALKNMQHKDLAHMLKDLGLGVIRQVPDGKEPPVGKLRFKRDGKDYWFASDASKFKGAGVPEDLMLQGLQGVKTAVPTLVKALAVPADVLRKAVRRMPLYTVRQTIRDPLHAWLTTGGNFTPILSSWKELAKGMAGNSPTQITLKEAAVIGNHTFSGDSESVAKMLRDMSSNGSTHMLAKGLNWLDELALQGEASTRAVLYDDFRKKGMSHVEALLNTAEVMNFSRRGTSASLHWLSTMIPFFHAQIQGLDAAYRALKGDTTFEEKLNARNALLRRGALLAAGTAAYALAMEDDDTYKNATPEERLGNWFVPVPGTDQALRVPIPFELGLIFKALPEAFINTAFGDKTLGESAKALASAAWRNVPLSPSNIPSAVRAPLELMTNTDFYSNQPIESAHEQSLTTEQRYRNSTTEVAKLLGKAGVLSPVQIDHLVRSFTSSMGIATLSLANFALRPMTGGDTGGEKPEMALNEMPVVGPAFQPTTGRGQVNAAFDEMKRFQQAATTFKSLAASDPEAARAFANKFANEIALASTGGSFRQQMGEFANYKRAIAANPSLTAAEKRQQIEAIKRQEIEMAKRVRALAKAA